MHSRAGYFVFTNLLCAVFQAIVILIFALIEGFCALFVGSSFWTIDQTGHVGHMFLTMGGFALFLSVLFGGFWLLVWYVVYVNNETIRWFYWKVAFATLPFALGLALFNPKPDPMAMIPTSHAEFHFIFSCIVTGLLLFPLYSIAIYKFVLLSQANKLSRFLLVSIALLILGSGLFIVSWSSMHYVYPHA